uniref:Uncharacterized protein n=1 Tax=viral metagenome TaxID=1070528 RepID=A0A6C0HDM0_9ZZZZ
MYNTNHVTPIIVIVVEEFIYSYLRKLNNYIIFNGVNYFRLFSKKLKTYIFFRVRLY